MRRCNPFRKVALVCLLGQICHTSGQFWDHVTRKAHVSCLWHLLCRIGHLDYLAEKVLMNSTWKRMREIGFHGPKHLLSDKYCVYQLWRKMGILLLLGKLLKQLQANSRPPIHVNTTPHENTRLWLTATHGHLLVKQSSSTLHAPTFGKHVKEVITPRHQTLIHSHFEIDYSWAHPPSSSAVALKHTFRAHRKMTIRCLIDQIDQCVRWILLLLLLTSDRCLPWFSSVHVCLGMSM